MAKSSAARNKFLLMLFNGTAWANIADNAATAPVTQFFISLHTADPGIAGTMNTSECTYTGYTRIAAPRTSGEWTVTANSVQNTTEMSFPIASGGSETATYASIGMPKISGAAGSITCTSATPGVFTWTSHGLSNNMPFYFSGTAPTGLTANTVYFVKSVTANTFEVALTAGGASIATSSTGSNLIGYGGGTGTEILYSGALSPSIVISSGVTPILTLASAITET